MRAGLPDTYQLPGKENNHTNQTIEGADSPDKQDKIESEIWELANY